MNVMEMGDTHIRTKNKVVETISIFFYVPDLKKNFMIQRKAPLL